MPIFIAILLGIVEGLTEYLPVSSTGHLVLVGHWLGLGDGDPATSSFDIVIQLGAILAVVVDYRVASRRARARPLRRRPRSSTCSSRSRSASSRRRHRSRRRKAIKAHLFGPLPVAAALVVGGVVMIVVERVRARRKLTGLDGLENVTPGRALTIGFGQCISMWPGTSRSMCTIVAGQLSGLSTATAAEFSFLLALPTLGAATLYEGFKARHELVSDVGGRRASGSASSFRSSSPGRSSRGSSSTCSARARAVRLLPDRARARSCSGSSSDDVRPADARVARGSHRPRRVAPACAGTRTSGPAVVAPVATAAPKPVTVTVDAALGRTADEGIVSYARPGSACNVPNIAHFPQKSMI